MSCNIDVPQIGKCTLWDGHGGPCVYSVGFAVKQCVEPGCQNPRHDGCRVCEDHCHGVQKNKLDAHQETAS